MAGGIFTGAKVTGLFPTNIMKFKLFDHYDHWDNVMNLLLDAEQTEKSILEGSGQTSFIEDWDKRSFVLDQFPDLKSLLLSCTTNFCFVNSIENVIIDDSWYTIMHKGSRIQRHRHENSVWSGTLYVNAPKGSHGLAFANPTIPYRMMERQNATNPSTTYAHLEEVETGDLLLYPSWMEHFVPTIDCDNRTTISFNTAYPVYQRQDNA
jgi:uncharacterized protein (TIGR02466 family)|tara:strand:- start:1216 stop:1839 length:624 start_codon:yes stop_codon:yes gene_type:complete